MKLIHYQVEFKTYLGVLSQDEEWVGISTLDDGD